MILFFTQENFSALDRQIEETYRLQRHAESEFIECPMLQAVASELAMLAVRPHPRKRVNGNVRWLRNLKSDIERLRAASMNEPSPVHAPRARKRAETGRATGLIKRRSRAGLKPAGCRMGKSR